MLPCRSVFIPMDCFTNARNNEGSFRTPGGGTQLNPAQQGRQQYSVSKKIRLLLKSLGSLLFTSSQICVLNVAEGVLCPVQLSPKVPQCEQDTVLDLREIHRLGTLGPRSYFTNISFLLGTPSPSSHVNPGATFVYTWEVPNDVGPTSTDPNCLTWSYFSSVDFKTDINSGLIGPLLVQKWKS